MGNGHTAPIREQNFGGVVIVAYAEDGTTVTIIEPEQYNDAREKFPGGGIEADETPEMAAQRELEEETGIHIPLEKFHEFLGGGNFQKHYVFALVSKRRLEKHAERGQDGEHVMLTNLRLIEAKAGFLNAEHRILARLALWDIEMRDITKPGGST